LLAEAVAGLLSQMLGQMIPPEAIGTVLSGGLINPPRLLNLIPIPPLDVVLPGVIPTIQGLVDRLLGSFGGADMLAASPLAALTPVETEGQIEGAVNFLLFNLVASPIFNVTKFVGSLLAPLIGEEAALVLPIAALGLTGPLISGPGSIGTALQDVVDSLGSGNFAGVINQLIGAPATVIDGFVNGGYGPDLFPLVSELLPAAQATTVADAALVLPKVFAGGIIQNPAFFYIPELGGVGLNLLNGNVILPAVIPTIQGLVSRVFGLLPGLPGVQAPEEATAPETFRASTFDATDTSNKNLVTLDVAPGSGDEGKGKGNSGNTPGGPVAKLTAGTPAEGKVPPKVEDIKQALEETSPGPQLGKEVSEAAKPDKATGKPTVTTDATAVDTTDGNKVVPETTGSDNAGNGKKKGGGGSNPVGSAISSVAKNLAGAVRGALGG
jgi:hypothetical protein